MFGRKKETCGECESFLVNWATTQIGIGGHKEWYCRAGCGSPFMDNRVDPSDTCHCNPSQFMRKGGS